MNRKMHIEPLLENIQTGIGRGRTFEFAPVSASPLDLGVITIETAFDKAAPDVKIKGKLDTAIAEDDITEFIVYRKKISEIQDLLKTTEISMLINPANTGGDLCGLTVVRDAVEPHEISSSGYTVIGNPLDNIYMLFGFIHPVAHRTFLRFRDGYFECGCIVQRNFMASDSFESDTLFVKESNSPHDLLNKFGTLCANNVRIRTLKNDYVAWNSWDYYFKMFEDDDLRENIQAINGFNHETGSKIKMIMLDDGWFNDFGDWRANGRFQSGLKGVADKIKNAGFDAGIWLAPFHVSYFSRAFQRTPEILASFRDGKSRLEEWAFGPVGFVDPTSPSGEKFLTNVFKKLKNAGFSCFKVDFVHYLITFGKDKHFFDDKLGRIEVVRRGLSIIRDAIGEDAYLLTCGCPPEAAIGIADANRIGGDISTYDSTVKLNTRFLAGRYWMNNLLFTSDPDFLIVRSDATAEDRHHNPIHFNPDKGSRSGMPWHSENSSRLWATLAAMSGGFMVLADHLGKLKPSGTEMIKTALQNAAADSAVPLDLMEHELPEIWLRSGDSPALAVINWSDRAREVVIDLDKFPDVRKFIDFKDLWHGTKFTFIKNNVKIEIPAMDAVWFVKK